ncbi:MAG: M16 family metallopeptidase [Longimicrobiales bacterium]
MNHELSIPFERHQLSNGLRLILSRDTTSPVVAVNLWYDVGSKNERPGRTGFAHLFEHMMFQGSEHVPASAHFAYIEKAGGSLNGSTWLDRTNYFDTVPSHFLELALWLESDRLGYLLPAMTQEKLDNQRDVVKNERRWRVDNQPYGDWDERLQALLYPPDHPYHHSVIGSMEDLDAASLADVEAFFRTYYAPNNAVLTLCGDFESERARALVDRYFGSLPRGPDIPPVPGRIELPAILGESRREVIEQDISLPRIYAAYRIPPYGHPAFYAATVAAHVLADGKSALLYDRLVRTGMAQDVFAFPFPIVLGAAVLVTWATASPRTSAERLEKALRDAMAQIEQAETPHVERAIRLIEADRLRALQQFEERADTLSMYETLFRDPGRINTELERVRAVSAGDVRRFAAEFLGANNRTTLVYLPRKAA